MSVDLRDVLTLLRDLEWSCDGSLGYYCPCCGNLARIHYERAVNAHRYVGEHADLCELRAMIETLEQELA